MKTKAFRKNILQNTSHKSHAVIKSRDLNEAHFPNFCINEYKLFSLILSKAIRVNKNNQKEFIKAFCETHIITPQEFSEIFEVPINHCYKILKDSVETLIKKTIIVKSSTKDVHMTICSVAAYDKEKHHLEVRISHEIIPYLDVSVKFVKTRLYQIARLKSLYSIRLYELIVSFRSLGKCSMSIEKLRLLLGVGEDKLIKYADFKKYALLHAINEVNKVCNFDIKSAEKKEGRKVAKIDFTYKKPKSKELDADLIDTNKTLSITYQEDVRIRLIKIGVEQKMVKRYSKYLDSTLENAYEAIKKAVESKTLRKTATAYFVNMMTKG